MRPQNAPSVTRSALFGGTGDVTVWDLLAGKHADPFTAVLACELSPKGRVGRHQQTEYPEIVLGLEGSGKTRVDGVEHPMGPGSLVYLPLGSVLEIENTDDAPLRYAIIKAKA